MCAKDDILYKPKPALTTKDQEYIKPVFVKLANDELLKRCLGRNIQNNNEYYNKTLGAIISKHMFLGRDVTELATYISSAIFNEGRTTLPKIIRRSAYHYAQSQKDQRIAMLEKRLRRRRRMLAWPKNSTARRRAISKLKSDFIWSRHCELINC